MSKPLRKNEEELEAKRTAGAAIGFGTSFAVGMALFGLGGHWLDVKYDREPLFTLIGLFLGLIYGGWELWKLTNASNAQSSDSEDSHRGKDGGNPDDAR